MRSIMPAAMLLLLFLSCNGRYDAKDKVSVTDAIKSTSPVAAANEVAADTVINSATYAGQPKQPPIPTPTANPDWDRKVIKTADLRIETKSFARFADRLHSLVRENGGYIAQEEQTQSPSQIDNTVSIKVPVDRFDDLVQKLPADSDRLTDKKVTSQDVSMEVVDTRSRLETKKEVRERYLDLLRQAHKMEDILSLQQEINGIQEQMDAAASRVVYLSHSAAFSTVNLKFYQILDPAAHENPAPEPTFLHKIKLSFLAGWEYFSAFCLGLLAIWPLWLAAGLGYMAWRRYHPRVVKKPA